MRLNSPIKNMYYEDGDRYVKVDIIADAKPDKLPITGEDVVGLSNSDYIGVGSVIVTVAGDCAIRGESGWGDWL